MKTTYLFLILLSAGASVYAQDTTRISVNVHAEKGRLDPVWAWFGYDEPNYTYMKDGKKLLSELADLSPVPVYVRTHNLLTSGNGKPELKWGSTNAYTEDKKGKPVYNWTIVDSVIDTYVERGMRPLMEIGFMPQALSTNPILYKHTWATDGKLWTGWTYPPKDYTKWSELVYQWVVHSIDRYGRGKVHSWYWELWNEPNIGYWSGTFDEYCKLYDYTASAVKRACPGCRIGGPHTTNPNSPEAEKFLVDFLNHCVNGKNYVTGHVGSPLDYISFHAKGNPTVVDGHVRMNMSPQLKAIEAGFRAIAGFDKLKKLPVVIGECDPEGCAACSMEKQPQNGYRNGTMYSSYTAASYARIYELAEKYQIHLVGILTWAFEFEDQNWFAGFRDLATNGVDKPVLNVFRMFGLMPPRRLEVENARALTAEDILIKGVKGPRADVHGLASRDNHSVAVLIWNYHDDDVAAEAEEIELTLSGLTTAHVSLSHYRIDSAYSNAYETWKYMGSPQRVKPTDYAKLEQAGQLQQLHSPKWTNVMNGKVVTHFRLPRQGVSLIKVEW